MASTAANLPAPQHVATLTHRLYDNDPDHRYMSLNDLIAFLNTSSAAFLAQDFHQCAKVVDGFLHTLNDTNGEVQNLTIQCLRPFVSKCNADILSPLIHKVSTLKLDTAVDGSVITMALRAIVISLPRPNAGAPRPKPVQDAYTSISRVLIPRLVGHLVVTKADPNAPPVPRGLLQKDLEEGGDGNAIEVLTELAKCFGPMLQQAEVKALQSTSMQVLESQKSNTIMKKKAVAAMSALAQFFSDGLLSNILSQVIEKMRDAHITTTARKLYFNLLGSMSRSIPTKFGPHLKQLTPFVISALSQQELDDQAAEGEEHDYAADEMREAAITSLEYFYASCPGDMQRFNKESLDALLRFLRYDSALAADYDDELGDLNEEDEELEADEDFEQEDMPDDEDDVSWKVRRCAAKALQTVIATKGKDLLESSETFEKIVRSLLDRFKEREESVRVEVVSTTSFLVRKSKREDHELDSLRLALDAGHFADQQTGSRKRRRADSDVTMSDPAKYRRLTGSVSPGMQSPVPSGAPSNLARITPEIMRNGVNLALSSQPKTKIVSVVLLKDVVIAQHGATTDSLKDLFELVRANIESLPSTGLQTSSSTSGSIHIESLQLLSEIAKSTNSQALQPFITKIVPVICKLAQGKVTQLACEALKTIDQIVKTLTPPRAGSSMHNSSTALAEILSKLTKVISNRASDLVVRQQAISVLSTLLGRTSSQEGSQLLTQQHRQQSLQLLFDACQNETTRYTAIKAVTAMTLQAPDGVNFPQEWFTNLCTELGMQLRKQDRSLRGASLQALRTLIVERGGTKNLRSSSQLTEMLVPLLSSGDVHLTGLSVLILAALLRDGSDSVISDELIRSLCDLLRTPASASVVEQLSFFMDCVGQRGVGQQLMQAMLKDVGVGGAASVVGKVIGDLLTSSGGSAGISIDAFRSELQTATDERRKCLALSVIGEFGLRSGSSSGLKPDLFLKYFDAKDAKSEVPMAAAVALGRAAAGAGNAKTFVPAILSRVGAKTDQQGVTLHGIKELLHYSDDVAELTPFLKNMWDAALSSAKDENSRAVGAECLAKIAELEPRMYLQNLQALLSNQGEFVRLLCIIALRDIFTHTDITYSKYLRPMFVSTLDNSLRDVSPENRRNALNTFSAAARSKPELTLPHLSQLLPVVLDQTAEDPALIREVAIGPFKQRVDDGLEARKSAYETIYSLLEQSPQSMSPTVAKLLPRIVAGIGDDATIRSLSIHMLLKLASSAAAETTRWLDHVAEQFQKILATQLKDTAVRTEIEKNEEAKRTVVKVSIQLNRIISSALASIDGGTQLGQGGMGVRWQEFVEEVRNEWAQLVKDEEKALKQRGL